MIEQHGDTLISTSYKNYRQRLEIVCHKCNCTYSQTFQCIQKGFWCTENCKRDNYSNKKVHSGYKFYKVSDVKAYISEQGDTLISKEYKNGEEKLEIQCGQCNQRFHMNFRSYKHGEQRCPPCQLKKRSLSHNEFKKYVEERGDILLNDYTNSRSKVTISCAVCSKEYCIQANTYRRGGGCKTCVDNKQRLAYDEVRKRIGVYGDTLLSTEYINTKTPLKIKCGLCTSIFYKTLSSKYTSGCNKCNATSLEKLMHKYLTDNNYEYLTQHTFYNCRGKRGSLFRFDFYIPHKNIIIEVDGLQHTQVVKKYGSEWFDVIQQRDIIKTRYCKDSNIKMIRICAKDIRNTNLIKQLFERIDTEQIVYSDNEMYDYIIKEML
jgi:very-short-patch-repair endonuclease